MNYAKLPTEELEDLVQQQEQHLRELTEALLNGRRAHQLMKSALIDKRQDATIALLGKNRPGCVIFTRLNEQPNHAMSAMDKLEQEYQAKREMLNLINMVGEKYELL